MIPSEYMDDDIRSWHTEQYIANEMGEGMTTSYQGDEYDNMYNKG